MKIVLEFEEKKMEGLVIKHQKQWDSLNRVPALDSSTGPTICQDTTLGKPSPLSDSQFLTL
jgi:hypothetical protein